MSPLLGLLLLFCGRQCALPLPGHVLEVRAVASDWRWCLRGKQKGGLYLCDDAVEESLRGWVAAATRWTQAGLEPGCLPGPAQPRRLAPSTKMQACAARA